MVKKIKESRMFHSKAKKKSKTLTSKTVTSNSKSKAKLKKFLASPLKVAYVSALVILVLAVGGYSSMELVARKDASAYNPDSYRAEYFFAYAKKLNDWGCPYGPYLIPSNLSVGSRGGCVRYFQNFLNRHNYFQPQKRIAEDGVYGSLTATRAREFQDWLRYFGRTSSGSDGVVGPATWTGVYYCYDPVASRSWVGGSEFNRLTCYAGQAPWN